MTRCEQNHLLLNTVTGSGGEDMRRPGAPVTLTVFRHQNRELLFSHQIEVELDDRNHPSKVPKNPFSHSHEREFTSMLCQRACGL